MKKLYLYWGTSLLGAKLTLFLQGTTLYNPDQAKHRIQGKVLHPPQIGHQVGHFVALRL